MVLVGIRGGASLVVDRVQGVCSRFDANGHRTGAIALTGSAGGSGGSSYDRTCSGDGAVTQISGMAGTYIDHLFVWCAPIASNGLHTAAPEAITFAPVGSSPGGSAYHLPCPNDKIGRGITGMASAVVDRIALLCNVAPMSATRVADVALNDRTLTSGAQVSGTVTFNGYAPFDIPVTFNITGAGTGASISPVYVVQNARTASFTMSTGADAAGCAVVTPQAQGLQSTETDYAVMTPVPPSNASFSFTLVSPPGSLTYIAPGTINVRFAFNPSPLGITLASGHGPVSIVSSNPSVVQVPPDFPIPTNIAVTIPLTASSAGCSVLSATSGGVTIRRTVRVVLIGG
jgi:hypothetical protein